MLTTYLCMGSPSGATAGGCNNYNTVCNNPQYHLSVYQPTTLYLFLAQHDSRSGGKKDVAIALNILNTEGAKLTKRYNTRQGVAEGEYINLREVRRVHFI